jgi:hypothetical protein
MKYPGRPDALEDFGRHIFLKGKLVLKGGTR